jgi:hypothetical protein
MLRADEFREILLELHHVRPEAERTVVEGARDGDVQFFAQAADLRGEIEIGNFITHFYK